MTDCAPLQSEPLVGNVELSTNQIQEELFSSQEGATLQPQTEQDCRQQQVEYSESTAAAAAAAASQSFARRQFACLYTKHKTQKRKIWKDGRLVISGCMAALHDAHPVPGSGDPILDQCEIARAQMSAILAAHVKDLETEKYLVTIEGPWTTPRPLSSVNTANNSTVVSQQMTKVISRKFRKPTNRIPPPPAANQMSASVLGKRRRPLQPGELQRRYHGNALATADQQQVPYHQQQQQFGPTGQQPPMPQNDFSHQMNSGGTHLPRRDIANSQLPPALHHHVAQGNRTATHHPSSRLEGSNDPLVFQNDASRSRLVQDPRLGVTDSAAAAAVATASTTIPYTNQHPFGPSQNEDSYQQQGQRPDSFLPLSPPTMATSSDGNLGNNQISTSTAVSRQSTSNIFVSNNGFDPASFYGEDDEEEDDDDDGVGGYSSTSFVPMDQNKGFTRSTASSTDQQPVSSKATSETEAKENSGTLTTSQLLDLFGAGNSTTQGEAAGDGMVSNKPSEKGEDHFELPDDDDDSSVE